MNCDAKEFDPNSFVSQNQDGNFNPIPDCDYPFEFSDTPLDSTPLIASDRSATTSNNTQVITTLDDEIEELEKRLLELKQIRDSKKRLDGESDENATGCRWEVWDPPRMRNKRIVGQWMLSITGKTLDNLHEIILPENWGNSSRERQSKLRGYLSYYFVRTFEQKHVIKCERTDGKYAGQEVVIWNTGLLTQDIQEIFSVMVPYNGPQNKTLRNPNSNTQMNSKVSSYPKSPNYEYAVIFFLRSSHITSLLFRDKLKVPPIIPSELPKRAFFASENASSSFYNPNVPLNTHAAIDWEHFLSRSRIPVAQQIETSERKSSNPRIPQHVLDSIVDEDDLREKFSYGLERTKLLLLSNPRLAVPQFFRDRNCLLGEIQLLVPIKLLNDRNDDKFDAVVALRCVKGSMNDEFTYMVGTILSPEDAYYNARVIQPVDQQWLLDMTFGKNKDSKNKGERSAKSDDAGS